MEARKNLYIGVFFIAMAILVLEIGLTRIFSITLWYHFGFLSISVAMLGLGASGAFIFAFQEFFRREIYMLLSRLSLLFSIANLTGFFLLVRIHPEFTSSAGPLNILKIALFYLILCIPFFIGGLVLSCAIWKFSANVHKVYFWDLAGTGFGCILSALVLSLMGAQAVVIISSILGLLASMLLAYRSGEGMRLFPVLSLILGSFLIIMPVSEKLFPLELPEGKALYHYTHLDNPAKVNFTGWNSFSRVDAFSPVPPTAWGLSPAFKGNIPPQIGITIDGDGFTSIVNFDGALDKISFLDFTPSSLVHQLKKGPDSLIIGSGGGIDVLTALKNREEKITAVEINPIICYLDKEKYAAFAGRLFENPKIRLVTAEGRNYIKKTGDSFDIIQLPLVDSWAATYSGAYSLTENYLYTGEAILDYWRHLKENGILSISRWEYVNSLQISRICVTALEALEKTGIKNLKDCTAIIKSGNLVNIMLKKGKFTASEKAFIEKFARERQFQMLYLPGMNNYYSSLLDTQTYRIAVAESPLDISAPTDDRPFFYLDKRFDLLPVYISNWMQGLAPIPPVFAILFVIIISAFIFSIIFIVLPLKVKLPGERGGGRMFLWGLYFCFLGFGYMILEVSFMEKFILYLAKPGYSLSIVLFSLITSSAMGSFLSGAIKKPLKSRLTFAVLILAFYIIFLKFFLPAIFSQTLYLPLAVRALISAVLLFPAGLVMGMFFPLGIEALQKESDFLVPWAWGVNGCASVVGSVITIFVAIGMGFWFTIISALLLYITAYFTALLSFRN
ncbi:MAG: hypothetical protein M1536_02360 [Firmicutes bacterium]|nr:hypothetical protein [Bacillota bacterium]